MIFQLAGIRSISTKAFSPAGGDWLCSVLSIDVSQAEPLFCTLDHDWHFADRQRPINLYFKRLAAPSELTFSTATAATPTCRLRKRSAPWANWWRPDRSVRSVFPRIR